MSDELSPDSMEKLAGLTDKLVADVTPVKDRNQRLFLVAEKFSLMRPEILLEVFRQVLLRSRMQDERYQDFFHIISDVRELAKRVGFAKMSEVYTIARSKSYDDVVRYMQMSSPARVMGEEDEVEVEDQILKDLTLGSKRQLAKTRDPDMISRLTNDQDPIVIQNLLMNPRVTIKEAVKVASKRPTSKEILRVVYRDKKWSNHYIVRLALVNNPYSPTEISMSLLHFLLEQDLIDVAENSVLHPMVRQAAVQMVVEKRKAEKGNPGEGQE